MRFLRHHGQGNFAAGLMLAMLLFRAYVPIGFMPANGSPFLLEICPQGLALTAAAHHHHGSTGDTHEPGGHGVFGDCPFGSAPAAGPITHHSVFEPAGPIEAQALPDPPLRWGLELKRAHWARGPPASA